MQQDGSTTNDYERSRLIQVAPDAVFDFVSDVGNLPAYLPTMKRAELQGDGRVKIEVEVKGQHHAADGFLHVDDAKRRLEWGSDTDLYCGWMTVSDEDGASIIIAHLTFAQQTDFPERVEDQSQAADPMEEGLENALDSIKNILEGTGGAVESEDAQ